MAKAIGRFIVVDPRVCHGQPTFRGTRILVADVLDQVATGMAWEAIAESVRLAREVLLSHREELAAATR